MQRALMQFFKPENYFKVREALIQAGRQDLIGNGCDCLIPAQPPKEAIEARRRRANDAGPLPHRRQPGEGREAGRARPAEQGLPAGAEVGEEAKEEQRLRRFGRESEAPSKDERKAGTKAARPCLALRTRGFHSLTKRHSGHPGKACT